MSFRRIRARWKVLGFAILLCVLANELPRLLSTYPSVVFARDGLGTFERVAGDEPRHFSIDISAHVSQSHPTCSTSTFPDPEQPLRLSSLTILDISNTALSRAVAAELLATALQRPDLDWVEVRRTDAPCPTSTRIGDQILRIEELGASAPWAGVIGVSKAAYSFTLGDLPGWGWTPEAEFSQAVSMQGEIPVELRTFGLPSSRRTQLATEIAELMDLDAALDDFAKTSDPAPALPPALLPTQADLEGSETLPTAAGIDNTALLTGVRCGCAGEAFWRYVGENALGVILSTREALQRNGWDVENASFGVDKKLHHFRASRERQHIDVVLDETRAQDVLGGTVVRTRPDDTIDLETLPPLREGTLILWLHWWKEPTRQELCEQLAQAEELGPAARTAWLANLPARQRAELRGVLDGAPN